MHVSNLYRSIWTHALLCLRLLNEIKGYYNRKGVWLIVKNFGVTHSLVSKQGKYAQVVHKHCTIQVFRNTRALLHFSTPLTYGYEASFHIISNACGQI